MKSYTLILFVTFILNSNSIFGSSLKKGLLFNSHEVDIKNRTSLVLNEGNPYNIKNIFTLEFDVYLRDVNNRFGYIFRILSDKNENFDLIANDHKEIFFVTKEIDSPEKRFLSESKKINVRITFDKLTGQIVLSLNGETAVYPYDLSQTKSLLVIFGECTVSPFISHDVPPMTLDNAIIERNGKIINKWMFDRYSGNAVYDSIEDRKAIFKNGEMLINHSLYWKKISSVETIPFPQVTFDSIQNQVLVLNEKGCISISAKDGTTSFTPMKNVPNDIRMNRFVYDYTSNRLLSYDLHAKRLNYYNSEIASWDEPILERADYSHQNRYISIKDSCLYLFGGYGHHQYRAQFFKINLTKSEWEEYDLSSTIMPRYLSAMGSNAKGDKLYILGGRGTKTGFQEFSPHNVFDLYEVDLKTMKPKLINKLSENMIKEDYVFSNNLIVDDENECLYVLAFPNAEYASYAVLKKISLTKPVVETYADTLQFNFYDVSSSCDLYYSPSSSKLMAVLSSTENDIKSTVDIYSLDFPPLKESEIYLRNSSASRSYLGIIITSVTLVVFILFLLIYFRYVKNKKAINKSHSETEAAGNADVEADEGKLSRFLEEDKFYERNKSSILFLGGFQVFDKTGKDITDDFSPILKLLLILIILYTQKNGKGISSTKMEEVFWVGKSDESARNNRNVNIRKLRILLENVGDVEIINKNNYWSISFSENIFSDYVEILRLVELIKEDYTCNSEGLKRLVELLSYGDILPNTQNEWVDPFKSDFSNKIIDILMHVLSVNMREQDIFNHYPFLLKMADVISTFDTVSEDAVAVKCKILYKIGKKGPAQKVYNSFIRDYKILLDEDYKTSLKELLNKKIE